VRHSTIEQLESRRLLANPALVNITSWIGNTFSAKLAASAATWVTQHVQNYVNDLFVGRDGTIFTNSGYDEGGGAAAVYKLDVTAKALTEIDAPPGVAGFAVTANAARVYRSTGNWVGGTAYSGSGASSVSRQFAGSDIRGLAASATEVYIADAAAEKIYVYDAALTTQLRSFAVNKPSKLALDPAGNLWVIENKNGPGARIACYSPTGTLITAITDVALPSALAIDPGNGQLLVADTGPSQQIRYYTNIDVKPTLMRTFGDYGGIFGGPTPGAVGPHRFNFIEGIGVDPSGNLYVANNGWARGLTIEAYAPNGTMISSVVGLSNIIDGAAYDAATDSIFGNDERYAIDWTAAPGKEATYVATLGNKLKYPNDPRYAGLVNTTQGVRVVQGHKLLAQLNMAGSVMTVYRQGQGETWVPSTMLNTDARFGDTEAYPPNHPLKGTKFNTGWIWRDANGNGDFDAGEYQEDPLAKAGAFLGAGQIWMDNAGNIWEVNGAWNHALREFPLQGFDAAGNPIYTFSKVVDALPPVPIDGNSLNRIQYDSDTDTMYLMGSSKGSKYVLVRYDHWSNAPQRAIHAGFPLVLPMGVNDVANNWPISWSVAGSYVFVGYSRQAPIEVYGISDGKFVGELQPSARIGDTSWLDASQSVNAFKRANGEYEIFEEEDAGNKIVWYRWTPQQQPQ
jgi:sugar lactone lactonase YvrE